jgi:hypothetical protein
MVQWRHIIILNGEGSATVFLSTILHGVTSQTTVIFRVIRVTNVGDYSFFVDSNSARQTKKHIVGENTYYHV